MIGMARAGVQTDHLMEVIGADVSDNILIGKQESGIPALCSTVLFEAARLLIPWSTEADSACAVPCCVHRQAGRRSVFHLADLRAGSKLALCVFLTVSFVCAVPTVIGAIADQALVNTLHVPTSEPLLRIWTGPREHTGVCRLVSAVCAIRHRVTD